jgi:hypothetical protein
MTPAEMRAALNFGPEWQVIWMGADPRDAFDHDCGGLYGPGGTYVSEWVHLPYLATHTPGVQAARCERCRIAWVPAMGGGQEPPPAA